MAKRTVALTEEQYKNIIETIKRGFVLDGKNYRPNERIATVLVIQANLGMRISDILNLRLDSIIKNGNRYMLDIVEKKTQKPRTFTVPAEIYNYIKGYCFDNNIKATQKIFDVGIRAIQLHLQKVCKYLGYENISTHSFRKFYATNVYIDSGYNVALVRELLQHADTSTTLKYIGISSKEVEEVINRNIRLI